MSFGIPIIHSILEWKKTIDSKNADAHGKSDSEVQSIYLPSVRDPEDDIEKDLSTEKSTKSGEAEGQQSNKTSADLTDKATASTDKVSSAESDNTDKEHEEENPTKDDGSVDVQDKDDDGQTQDDDDGVLGDEEGAAQSMSFNTKRGEKYDKNQPLLGLVLTPTRELAVQVKHHIDAVAQFTGL